MGPKQTHTKPRVLVIALSIAVMVVFSLNLTGCKAQQQMQQQIADMDAKLADAQRRLTAMDSEVKKANFEINQLKGLITKLGNVTVDLQRAEEERQKMAAEAKAKADAAKKKGGAKAAAKTPPKKKKH